MQATNFRQGFTCFASFASALASAASFAELS
jgi:hypothetical protein